jgi:TetR/AcrR family transcriptional regulator
MPLPKNTTRSRGRPKAEDDAALSREFLLGAALEAFAELGFEGTSLRKLAQRLGVSHGLLNIRLGSKEQLWQSAVEFGLEELDNRLRRSVPAEGSPETRFRSLIVETLDVMHSMPALLQVVFNEGKRHSPRLDFIVDAVSFPIEGEMDRLLAEGVQAGVFCDVAPQLLRLIIGHGAGSIFALQPLAERLGLLKQNTAEERRALAEQVADIVVNGLVRR